MEQKREKKDAKKSIKKDLLKVLNCCFFNIIIITSQIFIQEGKRLMCHSNN